MQICRARLVESLAEDERALVVGSRPSGDLPAARELNRAIMLESLAAELGR